MLTLLGLLGGFLARLAPEGLKMWQDGRDKRHELELMKLQMEQAERGISGKLDAVYAEAAGAQAVALQQSYRAELKFSGRFSASVRPVVTYLFMFSFIGFKAAMLYGLMNPALPWQGVTFAQAVAMVWGQEEMAIFAAIMSFWFGDRTIGKR